jgi:hypothetical protein
MSRAFFDATRVVPFADELALVIEHESVTESLAMALDILSHDQLPRGEKFFGGLTTDMLRGAITGTYSLPDTYSDVVASLPPLGDDDDRRIVRSVAGMRPNITSAIAGSERAMFATRSVAAPDVPIRIACEFSGWFVYSCATLSTLASGVIAAALSLKQSGGAVELYCADITGALKARNVCAHIIPVNIEAANVRELSMIAHAGVTRTLTRAQIRGDTTTTRAYCGKGGYIVSHARMTAFLRAWSQVPVVYVPGVWSNTTTCPAALCEAAHTSTIAVRDYVLSQVEQMIVTPSYSLT